jgi:hypothetical protein
MVNADFPTPDLRSGFDYDIAQNQLSLRTSSSNDNELVLSQELSL